MSTFNRSLLYVIPVRHCYPVAEKVCADEQVVLEAELFVDGESSWIEPNQQTEDLDGQPTHGEQYYYCRQHLYDLYIKQLVSKIL